MKIVKLQRHSVQTYEGLEVTAEMLREDKQKTIREFVKGVQLVEKISPERIIIHNRNDRLAISLGCWILSFQENAGISLSSPKVRYMVVDPEEIKEYESVKE